MNDSPKPSAPAGNSGTAVEVEIPGGMFFDARDYAPDAKAGANPTKSQENVSLARSRRLTAIHQKLDQLTIALKHLRTADAVGLVTQSMDVLVGITDQFHKQVHDLAKQADNAEVRYEEYFETTRQVPPAADVPPASATGASTQSVVTVVVAPKVRGLNHPSSMAEAISMRSRALAANPALAAEIARVSASARMEQR